MTESIKEEISNSGTEIVGGTVGALIGNAVAGPLGALVGSIGATATTKIISKVSNELSNRLLSKREEIKISNAFTSSLVTLNCKISKGYNIRDDGFFDQNEINTRSDGEEVLEAVLYKAQREPEEKKIPYIGNIFANVCLDEKVFPELAHQIIKTAEQLTYRQYCLLKLFSGLYKFDLRNENYRNQSYFEKEQYSILYECLDLYNRGLVSNGGDVAFGATDIIPAKMHIEGIGADCFNLMQLKDIPNIDVMKCQELIRR